MPNAIISCAQGSMKRYWWLAVLLAVLFAGTQVVGAGDSTTPFSRSYTSTAAFAVKTQLDEAGTTDGQRSSQTSWVINTGKAVISRDLVQKAAEKFGSDAKSLEFSSPAYLDPFYRTPVTLPIVVISVKGDNSELVQQASDWALNEAKSELTQLFPGVMLETYQTASAPVESVSGGEKGGVSRTRLVLFAVLGAVLGILIGMLVEFVRPRLRTRRDFTEILGVGGPVVSWAKKDKSQESRQLSLLGVSIALKNENELSRALWVAGLGAGVQAENLAHKISEILAESGIKVNSVAQLLEDPQWLLKVAPHDSVVVVSAAGSAKPRELSEARMLLSKFSGEQLSGVLLK